MPTPLPMVPVPEIRPVPAPPIGAGIVDVHATPGNPGRRWVALMDAAARPRNAGVMIAALVIAACCWPVSMALPYWLIGAGALHYTAGVSIDMVREELRVRAGRPFTIPLRNEVQAEEILAHDLRAAYLSILEAHEELRLALVAAPALQDYLRGAYERCAAAVQSAGRLALLGNPIHRYDATHDRTRMVEAQRSAVALAEAAADPVAARAFRESAAARRRQIDTHDGLHAARERIGARLELVRVTIETLVTQTVKLAVMDREQLELAGEPLSAQLASINDEVATLEAALEGDGE